MCEIHLGDTGTAFRVTIVDCDSSAIDLSTATTKEILFSKPNGQVVSKSADFYTNGTDGIIQYVTESGFLDQPYLWQLQAYVVTPAGSWKSNIYEFKVFKNLE